MTSAGQLVFKKDNARAYHVRGIIGDPADGIIQMFYGKLGARLYFRKEYLLSYLSVSDQKGYKSIDINKVRKLWPSFDSEIGMYLLQKKLRNK